MTTTSTELLTDDLIALDMEVYKSHYNKIFNMDPSFMPVKKSNCIAFLSDDMITRGIADVDRIQYTTPFHTTRSIENIQLESIYVPVDATEIARSIALRHVLTDYIPFNRIQLELEGNIPVTYQSESIGTVISHEFIGSASHLDLSYPFELDVHAKKVTPAELPTLDSTELIWLSQALGITDGNTSQILYRLLDVLCDIFIINLDNRTHDFVAGLKILKRKTNIEISFHISEEINIYEYAIPILAQCINYYLDSSNYEFDVVILKLTPRQYQLLGDLLEHMGFTNSRYTWIANIDSERIRNRLWF